jgi:hypothetical protein
LAEVQNSAEHAEVKAAWVAQGRRGKMSSKTREALNKIGNISAWVAENCNDQQTAKYMNDIIAIVQESVAAPLRNCDVGTAEEQSERFVLFCRRNSCRGVCYDICNFANVNRRLGWQKIGQSRCFAFWAQMPYESAEQTKTTETKTTKGE